MPFSVVELGTVEGGKEGESFYILHPKGRDPFLEDSKVEFPIPEHFQVWILASWGRLRDETDPPISKDTNLSV